ncbi:hypothetical protein BJF78_32605 [Pseudonocardia sp. CNS-139]|nr:hypothetical protein BJF78_32605 [Pseudonocardia sp. CNS-139]
MQRHVRGARNATSTASPVHTHSTTPSSCRAVTIGASGSAPGASVCSAPATNAVVGAQTSVASPRRPAW